MTTGFHRYSRNAIMLYIASCFGWMFFGIMVSKVWHLWPRYAALQKAEAPGASIDDQIASYEYILRSGCDVFSGLSKISLASLYIMKAQKQIGAREVNAALRNVDRAIALRFSDPHFYGQAASLYLTANELGGAIFYIRRGESWAGAGAMSSERVLRLIPNVYRGIAQAALKSHDNQVAAEFYVKSLFSTGSNEEDDLPFDKIDLERVEAGFADLSGSDVSADIRKVLRSTLDRLRSEEGL